MADNSDDLPELDATAMEPADPPAAPAPCRTRCVSRSSNSSLAGRRLRLLKTRRLPANLPGRHGPSSPNGRPDLYGRSEVSEEVPSAEGGASDGRRSSLKELSIPVAVTQA